MVKTVSFHLQKGGVGKTTISGTLACQSALDGYSTLLVDIDPQGNASSWFFKEQLKYEIADVLAGHCFFQEAIVEVPKVPNLFLLPTFGIGGSLKQYAETKIGDEPFVIQDLIHEIGPSFDRIILDLSPGLGKLERSAIIASDEIITPMTPEIFSLDGLEIFIDELDKIRKNLRSTVIHSKVIINGFDGRIKQHKEIFEASTHGSFNVYKIPVDPVFRKAQEKNCAPQLFRQRGRGLKPDTIAAIEEIYKGVWS
ncbi:MAG: ParA family protein [Sphaerochaetaceae bacterium]